MRKRVSIPLGFVIFIALVVVVALVVIYKSHVLENLANRYLAQKVAQSLNLDISIAEIDGSFFENVNLRGVVIKYVRNGDTATVAYFPMIRARYDLKNLLKGHWNLDSLAIINPEFYLRQDDSGKWQLPNFSGAKEGGTPAPDWSVDNVNIDNATVELGLRHGTYRIYNLDLKSTARSDEGTYTIDLAGVDFNSDDERLRLQDLSGMATIYKDRIALQDVRLKSDSTELAFSMVIQTKDSLWINVDIADARLHLPDIVSFFGLDLTGDLRTRGNIYHKYGKTGGNLFLSGWFEGRRIDSLDTRFQIADGRVLLDTLHGVILNGSPVHGYGHIDIASSPQSYYLQASLGSFNLNEAVSETFDSDLNGRVTLNGLGLHSDDMIMDLGLDLDESHFDIYHFHAARGQMTVTTNSLTFFPGFEIFYHDNRFQFSGNVHYDGDLDISGYADLPQLSDFAYQTFIDEPAGRAAADFTFSGRTEDPSLAGRMISDSLWLYGYFSSDFTADFSIDRFTSRKLGPVTITSRNGRAWAYPYDSMLVFLGLDSNFVFIDSARSYNEISSIAASGTFDYEANPQPLLLDSVIATLAGQSFISSDTQKIFVDSLGFYFDRILFDASGGIIQADGRVNYDESLDMSWRSENIDVNPWALLLSDSLFLSGQLSSTGVIFGTFSYPQFSTTLGLDSLTYKTLLLGDLSAMLRYEDTTLMIDSMALKSPEGLYTAVGEFPINLSLNGERELFDGRSQDIEISAHDKRLDFPSFALNSVDYMLGDFDAQLRLWGTPHEPHLDGTSSLKNGEVKLTELEDPLENVSVDLSMSDKLITINELSAIVKGKNHSGKLNGGGTFLINAVDTFTYAIRLNASNAPIHYELGDFSALANAQLRVNGVTPPTVRGTITLKDAYYRENFTSEGSGMNLLTALEADKTWDLDIMVEMPSQAWVKNNDIDAEFSGSVNIIRRNGKYNFLGTLEVIRGKYYLFDRTFRLEPGGQIIYDNIEEPNPRLDLQMTTRIRTPRGYSDFATESSYTIDLTLYVTGTLENPIISAGGDEIVSNEDLLPLLFADFNPNQEGQSGANPALAERITIGGVGLLASQVSKIGARQLGLETFEITPERGGEFDPLETRLTIGAYTLPNLYVFGTSSLSFNGGQEVGVEYRIGRHYLFEGRRDENSQYHFNFKLQWEY